MASISYDKTAIGHFNRMGAVRVRLAFTLGQPSVTADKARKLTNEIRCVRATWWTLYKLTYVNHTLAYNFTISHEHEQSTS